jgi:regulation of enolase protein 1 (concanavalin A-like superfamily)
MRCSNFAVMLTVVLSLSATGAEDNGRTIARWGATMDPDRDCQFADDQGKLTITVPGTYHDLTHSQGRDQLNAPRVIQEVTGDFDLQVKVHAFPLPAENTSTSNGVCFISSGLLIWQDADNFIRLDRASAAGLPTPGVLMEFYEKGKQTVQAAEPIEDKDVHLRVTRKGPKLTFAFSENGDQWTTIHTSEIPLPGAVSVGVLAINTTTRKFEPQFSGLKLVK